MSALCQKRTLYRPFPELGFYRAMGCVEGRGLGGGVAVCFEGAKAHTKIASRTDASVPIHQTSMLLGTRETAVIEHNAELGSAKVTFTLTGTCRLGCIAYLIDHMLQMRAHLLRNLVHGDVSDGLHGSNGINCGNFNMTVFLLLQNNVAG